MSSEALNRRKDHRRLIIAAVVLIAFCLIDTFNAKYDKVLRNSLRERFNRIDELETSLTLGAEVSTNIENAEMNKKIISIFVFVVGFLLLIFWVILNLKHKFTILFFLLVYLAGAKFIDYELLFQWSLNSETLLIAKHIIVRVFPAFLFLIMMLTVEFYRPLPKDSDLMLNLDGK